MKLTELTPEQKRIAIAEACGWRIASTTKYAWIVINPMNMEVAWSSCDGEMNDKPSSDYLPDYLNDLNAMHEAMRVLTDDIREVFSSHLRRIWAFNYNARCGSFPSHDDSRNATAAQRADAFLLATGRAEL
jgi:hypothetical protein